MVDFGAGKQRKAAIERRRSMAAPRVQARRASQQIFLKPQELGLVATPNAEAPTRTSCVVRVEKVDVRSAAAKRLFQRTDERAYLQGVAPTWYKIELTNSPRGRRKLEEAKISLMRAEYKGLR